MTPNLKETLDNLPETFCYSCCVVAVAVFDAFVIAIVVVVVVVVVLVLVYEQPDL